MWTGRRSYALEGCLKARYDDVLSKGIALNPTASSSAISPTYPPMFASWKHFEASNPGTLRCTVAWHVRIREGLLRNPHGSALKARPSATRTADAQSKGFRTTYYRCCTTYEHRPWDQDKTSMLSFFGVQLISGAPRPCLEMTHRMRDRRKFTLVGR